MKFLVQPQPSLVLMALLMAVLALGLFRAFGLLLSITGTFGPASYPVSKRTRELSIRVALGAQARQVLAAALGRMLVVLAGGSLAGCLVSPPAGCFRSSSSRRRRKIRWCLRLLHLPYCFRACFRWRAR